MSQKDRSTDPFVTTKIRRDKLDIIRQHAKETGTKVYKIVDDLLETGMKMKRMYAETTRSDDATE